MILTAVMRIEMRGVQRMEISQVTRTEDGLLYLATQMLLCTLRAVLMKQRGQKPPWREVKGKWDRNCKQVQAVVESRYL